MIILDTNVLSEIMKRSPNQNVLDWVESHPAFSLYITSVTQAEIFYGIRLLQEGKRKRALLKAAGDIFSNGFSGRILSFDSAAAKSWAEIVVNRRQSGKPISHFDAQIAAIALTYGARVATRNTIDFEGCGIAVVNPWEA